MGADAHDPPRLRDLWEQQASNWTRWSREPGHDAYWRFHRDAFLRLVPAPGHLTLDIGCGEGRLLRDLAQRGHRVVEAIREVTVDEATMPARRRRGAVAAHPPVPAHESASGVPGDAQR
jgi:2-polyprenyl-3-methyl-5-hydroxy-6-metoxy-1,4-benzoquinol methylase